MVTLKLAVKSMRLAAIERCKNYKKFDNEVFIMKKIIGVCLLAMVLCGCDSPLVKEISVANKSYKITEIVLPIHPAMFSASVSILDSSSDRVYTERVAKSCLKNYRVGDHIDLTEGLFSSVNKNGEATYSYGLVDANHSFCKLALLDG